MNAVELVSKGLSEQEAKALSVWIEAGKPGLSKYKAEKLGDVYCLGYTCQDIKRWFPDYPIEVILWARVHYCWDDLRAKYRSVVQQETMNAALTARMESIRFLTDVITATHVKFRQDILKYIADPDNVEAPKTKLIPDNIHSYGFLMTLLKEMVTPNQDKNKTESAMPLVTVNVNSSDQVQVSKVDQEDVKQALMKDLKK